jgi:hypothetical protein
MPRIDELLEKEPYGKEAADKSGLFMQAMRESLAFHFENCSEFRALCEKGGFDPRGDYSAEDIPYLPVGIFKTMRLISVKAPLANVRSSSTTGSVPSSVFLDHETSRRQRSALNSIMQSFIGKSRRDFIIFDSEETVNPSQGGLSSRATAIRGFLPFMRRQFYVLDQGLRLEPGLVRRAAEEAEDACFMGFTYLLYEAMQSRKGKALEGMGFRKPFVLHLGGWKRLRDLNISKERFSRDMAGFLGTRPERVIDIYGMTEQLGTVYPDCEQGYKHCPAYSDIIIRDVQSLRPARDGEAGLIQLISPLPHSYPGVSIISDDIGKVVMRDGCPCGRRGKAFIFMSRAEKAEVKGCGDTLREDA